MAAKSPSAYDVIVVGARCAGAPTAMLLAAKGHRVLLLEQTTVPSNMAHSTHLIHPLGLAYLETWGLLDAIEQRATSFIEWSVDLHGAFLHGAPPPVAGMARSAAPRRDILDGELARAAQNAGAELRGGCRVGGLLFENGRVVGVEAKDAEGRQFSARAELIIGADGPASMVARCVGAAEHHVEPPLQSNIWSYWRDVPVDHLHITIREGAGAFAFPSSDGTVLVAANLLHGEFLRARRRKEPAFHAMLRHIAPNLAEKLTQGVQVDRFFSGCTRSFVRRSHGPGWALVGDAGMKKDPVTAQGIASAFASADMLAKAVDRGLGTGETLDAELAEYERARDAWLLPYYDFTLRLAAFAKPNTEQAAFNHALAKDLEGRSQLFGAVSLTFSPDKLMAPDNMRRILTRAAQSP
ncbi:MAG: NAD(P)/FAD-dependent oxidoreductase [Proteobacteria bacterium]|nr:NAD(P)/FAD-dependent oxidoreductase [Pseudomonadota bacterium]